MSWYFVRTPRIVQWLFHKITWRIEKSNSIYLTFDDGPNPSVTLQLLDLLKKHNARATFFLLGNNAEKYPELVQRILEENHSIGFHCNEHTNSRKLNRVELLKNFTIPISFPSTLLYRPPYGKLRVWQYNYLKNKFPLIGWNFMPGDFDSNKRFEAQLKHLKLAKCGDIVVLHELPNTIKLLEAYLEQSSSISFEKL
jgi:peptidoglycan/xylan/chitin deacetylase (PgdA/CDA1 family)